MNVTVAGLAVVLFVLASSAALSVGMAYALHRWTRKRWVWALTPVFLLFWLSCGTLPLAGFVAVEPAPPPWRPAPTIETEPVGPELTAPAERP